jgi:DnaK suppressor protein
MTDKELQEIEKHIRERIKELETSLAYLKEETKAIEPSVSLGRLTRMEAISEKGVNEYVLAGNKLTLEKLNNALDRIKKGIYGNCVRCGGEIPTGRLRLVPEALVCVPCSSGKK